MAIFSERVKPYNELIWKMAPTARLATIRGINRQIVLNYVRERGGLLPRFFCEQGEKPIDLLTILG